jgi:hypothetical protein
MELAQRMCHEGARSSPFLLSYKSRQWQRVDLSRFQILVREGGHGCQPSHPMVINKPKIQ